MLNYSVAELRYCSSCVIFLIFCFAAKIRKYHEIRKKKGEKVWNIYIQNVFPVDSVVIYGKVFTFPAKIRNISLLCKFLGFSFVFSKEKCKFATKCRTF